jgi:esterase
MKLFFRHEGEGKPLIILHGLFGMSDNWMTLAKEFAANGFSVYLPDARNHGRSPHSDVFTFEAMSDDLAAFMENEGLSSASVIGHSMGGRTAMLFAMQHGSRLEKLIVVDIAPRAYPTANRNVVAALHSLDLNSLSSRKVVEEKLRVSLGNDEATIQFLLKNLYWKEGEEKRLAWRFNLDIIERNLWRTEEVLPAGSIYNGNTLFVRGEKSDYINSTDEPLIKKYFPNAQVKTIPDAGHWVHAENPKGFMEVVLKELNEVK